MKRLVICLIILTASLLTGCAGTAAVVRELKGDTATVCNALTTPWGNDILLRTNITTGEVSCNGLTVKSQGTTTIPVTVVPQTKP